MDNLKDIQNITGLTSEAIFNIRKPVDYMCSDIDSHIKDIETQCDYIMDRNPNEPKISYTLNDLEVRSRHSLFHDANITIIFMLQTEITIIYIYFV